MKRMTGPALLLGAILALAGCSLAPKYERPEAPVPAAWPAGEAYQTESAGETPAALPWSEFFTDERLRALIDRALGNNRDLRVAALNIERARALYRIQRAELLPALNARGSAAAERTPASLSRTGEAETNHLYRADVGFSAWEIDFFGRLRNLNERALGEYLATGEARRNVQIALVAEVADAWLTLAADRERLRVARETLAAQEKSFELTQRRFALGIASELALRQAQTSVEAARVDIARFTAIVAQDKNALDLLAGAPVPGDLLPAELGEVTAVQTLAPGLPSEILQRRPDILQAEDLLQAAHANIGAARAAFFPRITLTSSVGLGSSELGDLFTGGARLWAFAPQITLPIFNAGANRANLRAAETEREILLARYEQAIQIAFREVADALAVRGTVEEQLAAQQALVEAAAASYRLSEARFEKGVDSYLAVLDAWRTLYGAQQNLISIRLARAGNLVTLYRVLGGGA